MYSIGIDPSLTATAVCAIDMTGLATPHVIRTFGSKPADGLAPRFDRYAGLLSEIINSMPFQDASIVCVEGYSFASKGGKAFDRVEFGSLLRKELLGMFSAYGFTVYEVVPTSLKLFTAGHGHADKPAMAVAVYKRWGVEPSDDNQVDAYALSRMGACIAGFEQPQNDAQRRAIDSVVNGKTKKPKHKSA